MEFWVRPSLHLGKVVLLRVLRVLGGVLVPPNWVLVIRVSVLIPARGKLAVGVGAAL